MRGASCLHPTICVNHEYFQLCTIVSATKCEACHLTTAIVIADRTPCRCGNATAVTSGTEIKSRNLVICIHENLIRSECNLPVLQCESLCDGCAPYPYHEKIQL